MAEALANLGATHVWVAHGSDGLDEITTTGTTFVSEVKDGAVREFTFSAAEYGVDQASLDDLRGGDPSYNAERLRELLNGKKTAYADIVKLNAGVALYIAGISNNIDAGLERANKAIETGRASETLAQLVKISNAD